MKHRVWLLAAVLGVVGCGGGAETEDGGHFDGAPFDAAGTGDASARACSDDGDCDDELACNGEEACVRGACVAGTPLDCDDGVACTTDSCSEELRACSNRPVDADGDGVAAATCLDERGVPLGTDCDDTDALAFPGAMEICDAAQRDEDCNPSTHGGVDVDGDGFEDARCCNGDDCGADCNDAVRATNPDGTELCNQVDDDCDGNIDENFTPVTVYRDADGDGRGNPAMSMSACGPVSGYSTFGDDCDDTTVMRSPILPEVCDEVDNDCNDLVDDSPRITQWYEDADGDGFGTPLRFVLSCAPPAGRYSLQNTDCNDAAAAVSPSQAERCNGQDDDCNGVADYVIAPGDLEDDDRDGIADTSCTPAGTDCDDRDPSSRPGDAESCDGRDNDCDGNIDEMVVTFAYFRDADGDGYGTSVDSVVVGCTPVAGYVRRGGDCDDASPTRFPGAPEGCNGQDDDCDSATDENPASSLCPTRTGAVVACIAGACATVRCSDGFGDCDASQATGCESDLRSSATSCGSCGRVCTGGANSTAACNGGSCSVATCNSGYLDCNGDVGQPGGNGCEVRGSDDPVHCGACGNVCPSRPNAPGRCIQGSCAPPDCVAGFLDCNNDLGSASSDGCEVNGSVDPLHCGTCARACATGPNVSATCSGGMCSAPTCAFGRLDCNGDLALPTGNGCEVEPQYDGANCGSCGNNCMTAPFTQSTCLQGSCTPRACQADRLDCNGDRDVPGGDGCETQPATSIDHCGVCGRACRAGPNATTSCSSGACTPPVCMGNAIDCDGDIATPTGNGCETDRLTSTANCGTCGNDCLAAPHTVSTCITGGCSPRTCAVGFVDCNGDLTSPASDGCETPGSSCTQLTWARTWGNSEDNLPTGSGRDSYVATDAVGNVFAIGTYGSNITVGATPYSAGRFGAVLIALDAANNVRWVSNFGTASGGDYLPTRIVVDQVSGDVFVATTGWGQDGRYNGTSIGVQSSNCTPGVVRLSGATGMVIWGRTFAEQTGVQCATAAGLALGNGELVLAGTVTGSLTIETGTLLSAGGADGYVARIEPTTGVVLGSFRFGGTADEEVYGLARLPTGDIVLGGAFYNGNANIGGQTLTNVGGRDAFFARFTSGGILVHTASIGSTNNEEIYDVRASATRWYVGGPYNSSLSVGATSLSGASVGAFVSAIDSASNSISWTTGLTVAGNTMFGLRNIALDATGNLRIPLTLGSTTASRFGGVAFPPPTNTVPRIVYIDGATGAVSRIASIGANVAMYGHALAILPTGRNVIAGAFLGSGSVQTTPFASAGSWDQFVMQTSFD